jgi:hypothetical protein
MAAKPAPKRRRLSAAQQDRRLRERIAVAYANAEIASDVHLQNLERIVTWIKTGHKPGDKPVLTVVENRAV